MSPQESMNDAQVHIVLRIPGKWSHPRELMDRLPPDVNVRTDALVLADGSEFELSAFPADDQFANVFQGACRSPVSDEERSVIAGYTVNVCLAGPGGSLDAALRIMRAAAAIIHAGGAGVFIDNSALAHGGQAWLEMTEDASSDAVSFAFAAIIRGDSEVWTMGMHVLGLPDIVMKRSDADEHDDVFVEIIRYLASQVKPVREGHTIVDLEGPRFQAIAAPSLLPNDDSPMFNPFGRLKLVTMKDVAEQN